MDALSHGWTKDGVSLYRGDRVEVLSGLGDDTFQSVVTRVPRWSTTRINPSEYVAGVVKVAEGCRRVLKDNGTMWLCLTDTWYSVPRRASVQVHFSREDLELVELIARGRNDPKEAAGIQSAFPGKDTSYEAHRMGAAGEVAVAKYYNVLPSTYMSLFGERGRSDLIIKGHSAEVKTRPKVGWDFALTGPNPEFLRDEVGILVYELSPYLYEIHGIISREKFMEVHEIRDYGFGDRAIAAPEHFSDVTALEYKPGDLMGFPHKVVSQLRDQGWHWHRDIIWDKSEDRDGVTFSHLFLLSKSADFYQDHEAKYYLRAPSIKGSIEDMLRPCILSSCPEGGTVLDPFMGIGEAADLCRRLDRRYVGIEASKPHYVMATERLEESGREEPSLP